MSIEITSSKQGGEAKQDAFDQAMEQATQKMSEELLGADKMSRYWPTLRPKLLKNSTRYLLFIKGSPPVESGGLTKITVNLRLSPDNLETLLREEGVLNSGTLKILPLVEIIDSHGAHYAWWADVENSKPGPLDELFRKFFAQTAAKFKAKNVFVLDPTTASFRMSVPATYRSENLRHEDQMLLAQYLKADVVLSGKIESARPRNENSDLKLTYDLQLWQAKSGRNIGEIQRAEALTNETPKIVQSLLEQTAPKVLDDLSNKLSDAVASGNLNLNLVRVAVSGTLSYRQESEFKRQLEQVREIKALRERLFEPGRVVFEAETAGTAQELAKVLERTKFPLYVVRVAGAQDDGLALDVKAMSSASAQ